MKDNVIILKFYSGLKYAGLALLMLPLCKAEVLGLRPFGAAFMLALIFLGVAFAVIAPAFFLCELLAGANIANIVCALIMILIALICRVILIKTKNSDNKKPLIYALGALAGFLSSFVRVAFGQIVILQAILWCTLGVGFTLLSLWAIKPVVINKMKYKLLETETIACAVLLAAVALGLKSFNIYGFSIFTLLCIPIVLVGGYLGKVSVSVVCAVSMGVGAAVSSFDVSIISALVFTALMGCIFLPAPRVLSALASVMAYMMFMFFFGAEITLADSVALLCGAAIYMCIPRRFLDSTRGFLSACHSTAAARNMINRAKKNMGAALVQSGRIFSEMSTGLANADSGDSQYRGQLKTGVCESCENYYSCKNNRGFDDALDRLTEVSSDKGRASISELPAFLSQNCQHLNKLMMFASEKAEKNYAEKLRLNYEKGAREIVSEQLSGMSRILTKLGEDAGKTENFDRDKEKLITEELNYSGVIATEALVTEKSVSAIVRTETFAKTVCEKAVSRIMRAPFVISSADTDEIAGFSVLTLEKAPRFDVVFATSAVPKRRGEKSGDTHSFIKIGSDKFMMALCDGMGSGAEAEKVSETAIGLVESFYKAGFDHALVLDSVNKFLTIGSGERFSTLDITVIDLNSGCADIIKFGSPATIIKGKDTARTVEGSALPIGVVSESKPSLFSLELLSGEMLVMTSDGISESFDENGLLNAVNNLRTKNPALIASGLLEHSLARHKGVPKDDSTVLCARIFERV